MIFRTTDQDYNTIQLIPLKPNNYTDGIPFNYRSYEVWLSQAAGSGTIRIYPAMNRNGFLNTMHASFRGTRIQDIPYMEDSSGTWSAYNAVISTSNPNYIAPSKSYGYGYMTYNDSSIIESSYKDSRGLYTFTVNDISNPLGAYLRVRPYAILMATNVNNAPTVRPYRWAFEIYNRDGSINFALLPALIDEQYKILHSGQATINGVQTHYRIIAVYASLNSGAYKTYQFGTGTIREISAPFLATQYENNGDGIYFLEYGCEYRAIDLNDR